MLPQGLVGEMIDIRIVADDPALADPPQGFRAGDAVVDITASTELPAGQTATVCLPASSGSQRVHRYDESLEPPAWVELDPPPGGSPPGLACGVTDRFSLFALGSSPNETVANPWLARFGRTVGAQVVDALTARFDGGAGEHVTVGGMRLRNGVTLEQLEEPRTDASAERVRQVRGTELTAQEVVRGSSFQLSRGGGEGGAPALTAWGRVAIDGFEAEAEDHRMDGDVTTAFLGFDAEWGRFLAGALVSRSNGEGDYALGETMDDNPGTVESTLNGVYPYARLEVNERTSVWGLAGAGEGELRLVPEDGMPIETDLSMRMGAFGVRSRVLDGSRAGGLGLTVRSDAMWVRVESDETEGLMPGTGDVSRLRFVLAARQTFETASGGILTPTGEVGLRFDGGDAETGTGVELGGRLRYVAGPVVIEGAVRTLVAHAESGYREWGASGALRLSPSVSGRGLSLSLTPAWGNPESAADRLWSVRDAGSLAHGTDFEAGRRLDAELGYGIAVRDTRGVVTPYTRLSLSGEGTRTVRAGTRWTIAHRGALELSVRREDGAGGKAPLDAVELRTSLRW